MTTPHTICKGCNERAEAGANVQIGWDRPLHCFHLVVTRDTIDDEDGDTYIGGVAQAVDSEGIVYSHLNDRSAGFKIRDPAFYWNKLTVLAIACPHKDVIDREIRADQLNNVGNRHVWYDTEGLAYETLDA
jgi:hypothetical protein